LPSKPKTTTYVVANPRGLPAGKWIVKVDGRLYFEGDAFEGVPSARFLQQGYVIASERGIIA
jgi:hypothetical protein